ncbi:Centrosomal protein of 97 kDa [Pseudolycoriella hygida]|uniref:Centrosomal protein of 97 kDa n=1 Tax=Pseudolycoriella hygida TaxID=35572 RepID=A0A9Q0S8T6_9DIPT|nr:Centrosomal protein of 97 kDa [Pseudolycoriella hygida]
MPSDETSSAGLLDYSNKNLKKVPKFDEVDKQSVNFLLLDSNELQKLENIDSFVRVEKLSVSKNQLLRMYGLHRLHSLVELNLSHNGILTIEGLKELTQLTHLNLAGNSIKTIEHLITNTRLEHLNLSENNIGSISDISNLKVLKDLLLHGNRITHLRQCEKYLPHSLEQLTLSKNAIADLNEICSLSHLSSLRSISLSDNPCVQMTGNAIGFDYRPFVLNWCMSIKIIDDFMVNPIESLKAEWLYSQGRGRQFRVGEQVDLAKYLSSVCPLSGEVLENENERKLRLILSKAQQHQRQLQEEISENTNSSGNNSPSSSRRKSQSSRIQSPRFSRLGRQGSPDSMSSSYHGITNSSSLLSSQTDGGHNLIQMSTSLISNIKNDSNLMIQSLDPNLLSNNIKSHSNVHEVSTRSTNQISVASNQSNERQGNPLTAASKMVPVPESLMSPDCPPTNTVHRTALTSSNALHSSGFNNSSHNKFAKSKVSSPKNLRTSSAKRQEKSPNLNVTRKANSNLVSSLRISNSTEVSQVKQKAAAVHIASPNDSNAASSDDDSDHINTDKLKTIRNKAAQRNLEKDFSSTYNRRTKESAIIIQKIWRGYKARKSMKNIAVKLQNKRTQDYIEKLTHDMETTKVALENERKIQQLQMQAISALWKKVSSLQTSASDGSVPCLPNNSTAAVNDLAKTCSVLTNQVQQLQGSMTEILQYITTFCAPPNFDNQNVHKVVEVRDNCATQTEIVAVHTPQVDNLPFPFNNKLIRPSTLPLESNETSPLQPDIANEVDEHFGEGTPNKDRFHEKDVVKVLETEINELRINEENNKDLIIAVAEQKW